MKDKRLSQILTIPNPMILLLSLLICSQCTRLYNQSAQLLLNTITTTNSTIATQAQYTFTILRITGTLVPINSSLEFTFSNDYLGLIASTPTCTSNDFGNASLSCSYSGTTLLVSKMFSNPAYLNVGGFSISVSNIVNPSPARDYTPVSAIQILNAGATVIDSGVCSNTLTITSALSVCATTILNPHVFQNGSISISYTSNYIPAGSASNYNLSIKMNTSYYDDSTDTNINPILSVPATLSAGSANNYIFEINFVNNFIITMLMPPSSKPENNFITIFSYNGQGAIDQCSITISSIQPNTFATATISQAVVQTSASLSFNLKLSSPLLPADTLQFKFDSSFSLAALSSTVNIAGYGSFPISKISNLLSISGISSQAVLGAELIFSLSLIGMPFTTQPYYINISLITNDGYYRTLQNYVYASSPGIISGSISCLDQSIGANTYCLFVLATSSAINSSALFQISLPNDFPINSASIQCGINGVGLNSISTCLYFATNNSISVGQLTSSSNNITPMNLTLNISMSLSPYIKSYQIDILSNSLGFSVDSGSLSLITIARQLSSSQFSITSSSLTTYSLTTYNIYLSLPINIGYVFSITVNMPFDAYNNLPLTLSHGNMISFTNQLLTFTTNAVINTNIIVSNLMTYASLQPNIISINITYQGTIYFYGSQTLTLNEMKTFDTISVSQDNRMVYAPFVGTFTLSSLNIGDKIVVSANYNYFYSTNQSSCTASVITCGLNGQLTVEQSNNSANGLTIFLVNLMNIGYISQYTVTVTAYDSQRIYGKQSSIYTLSTTVPNSLSILTTQTNPYLRESSSYTFNITLTTPGATSLLVISSSAFVVSAKQCVLNCGTPSIISLGYLFPINSVNVIVTLTATNPSYFDNSTNFVFKTSSLQGDMDYGSAIPTLVCNSPCRSCSANKSQCLTCYPWQNLNFLYSSSCVAACPNSTYQSVSNGYNVCLSCDSKCWICTASSTNCSSCVSPNYYYNSICYQRCPNATYPTTDITTSTLICANCIQNCAVCTSFTICTQCSSSFVLFSNSCYNSCPSMTYNYQGVCINCSSTCSICDDTNGSCTRCITSYFLYNGACWSSCPSGVHQQNINNTCETCKAPCASCSISSTNCSSCVVSLNSTRYYYLDNACYASVCPDTYYISPAGSTCLGCTNPCLTCSSSSCLTCNTSMLLYRGSCYSTCPLGSFPNSSAQCSDCPSICSQCLSASLCTACINNYFLFNSSCITTCPSYYFATNTSLCQPCSFPCLLCSSLGCLSCSNTSFYLQGYACQSACNGSYHPNNSTMMCQNCQLPCLTCTWSSSCSSCLTNYLFFNSSCLVKCPMSYYSDGATCNQCPVTCSSCIYTNMQVSCTSCVAGNYVFGYQCLNSCPNNTQQQNQYCLSPTCTSLQHCVVCSSFRCLQCASLYSLDSNYQCTVPVSSSTVLSAISQIPVPFPFLIAIVMIIITSFFLKYNFPKMYAPLFIYSLAGVCQFLNLALWTILSLLWNMNITYPLPIQSVVNAPVVIVSAYVLLNILQLICWCCRIASDKKYMQWQRQDNKSASIIIAIVSLAFSFRFDTLKYSQVGHSQRLSAKLESADKFKHYSILAVLSTFVINLFSIVISIYISYLQTSMNYLFFTGLEVTIIAVIMIILNFILLCIHKDQLVEMKQEYHLGFDNDQIEGKSIAEMLNAQAMGEEYNDAAAINSQSVKQVFRKNQFSDDQQSQDLSEGLIINRPNDALIFADQIHPKLEDWEDNGIRMKKQMSDDSFSINYEVLKAPALEFDSHSLVDEIDQNRNQALSLAKQYIPEEKGCSSTYPRQIGSIIKQKVLETSQDHEESQELQQFDEYMVAYRQNKWKVLADKKQIGGGLQMERSLSMGSGIIDLKAKERQELKQQQLIQLAKTFEKQQRLRLKLEQMKQQEQQLQLKLKREQQMQRMLQARQKQEERIRQEKEYINQQLRNKQEMEKLNSLKDKLTQLEQMEQILKQQKKKAERDQIAIENIRQDKDREQQERVLMTIEDRLSKTAQIFSQMREKTNSKRAETKLKAKKIAATKKLLKDNSNQQIKEIAAESTNYHNNDNPNLISELSPRRIKVNPVPSPQQYQRHLYVESGGEILSDDGDEEEQGIDIVWNERDEEGKAESQPYHKNTKRRTKTATNRNKNQAMPPTRQNKAATNINVQFKSEDRLMNKYQGITIDESQRYRVQSINNNVKENVDRGHEKEVMSHEYKQFDTELQPEEQYKMDQQRIDFAQDPKQTNIQQLRQQQQSSHNPNQHRQPSAEVEHEAIDLILKQTQQIDINDLGASHHAVTAQSSARSIHSYQSSTTHWPIEPEMKYRILQIEKRANQYLNQPKKRRDADYNQHEKYAENPSVEIYEQPQEDGETELGEIVFEESEQIQPIESSEKNNPRIKYPRGRVNRRIIDLSPDK